MNDSPAEIFHYHKVLETIAFHYFGEQTNLVTFSDVKLPNYGTLDFVLARHKSCIPEIDDFVPVEVKAFLPTRAAQSVRSIDEFMAGGDVSKQASSQSASYERTIRKFLFQLFNRGIVYEAWGVKSYWVIQELVYVNMVKCFGFKQDEFSSEHALRFALQDVSVDDNRVNIKTTRYVSVSVDEIYRALRSDSGLPSKTQFIAALDDRLRRTIKSGIRKKLS